MTTNDGYLRDPHLGTCVDKRAHGRHTLRTSWGEFGCPGWPRPGASQQPTPADPTAAPQHWHVTACVHQPLTQEQREQLFDAVADAAHEVDARWSGGPDVDVSGAPCRCLDDDKTAAPQPAPCWVHAGGDAGCRCFDEPAAPQPAADAKHIIDDAEQVQAAILEHPVSRLRDLALDLLHDLEQTRRALSVAYERLDRLTAAPQPAPLGEDGMRRERAILRWAADRLDDPAKWADPLGRWTAEQAEAASAQKQYMLDRLRRWAVELHAGPQPATPGELDLDEIEREWLVQCGPCDYGLVEFGCQCPAGDYRPPMAKLAAEVRQLRREWQLLTDRWGHYKRQYLGALNEAQRRTAERDMLQQAVDDWARTAGQDMRGLVRAAQDRPISKLDAAPATPGQPALDAASELAEAADAVRAELELERAELDADPDMYQLPAEPPVGTKLWNRVGRWTSRQAPWSDPGDWPAEWCLDGQHYGSGVPWHALLASGPLSTTPPAGTEGEYA